ncbi:hypothetical protein VNO77_43611 [Canavalia gladiata]|uniref:Glabrous enhancer-binding protein-like DBD domain-containing protein n=1 Tax=Canavalia gladiata TaxID=3824 RepID=A0AAN9JX22_CANGL
MDMDSTTSPPLPLKSSAAKLPIKRKTLPSSQDPSFNPNPNPPPFKFHRIWTEPDEIRFLRGLLDSSADGLLFPRDLHLFYHRFSAATPQPYSKSQLSEKLRRLRKKFRSLSSRRHRLDSLSPHDRALFELSDKLWGPEFGATSPFGTPNASKNPNPKNEGCCDAVDAKMGDGYCDAEIGGMAAKTVLDVFDECVKEAKMGLLWQGILCSDHKFSSSENGESSLWRRWQEQRALELDVFARRLRLVIENSLGDH